MKVGDVVKKAIATRVVVWRPVLCGGHTHIYIYIHSKWPVFNGFNGVNVNIFKPDRNACVGQYNLDPG